MHLLHEAQKLNNRPIVTELDSLMSEVCRSCGAGHAVYEEGRWVFHLAEYEPLVALDRLYNLSARELLEATS